MHMNVGIYLNTKYIPDKKEYLNRINSVLNSHGIETVCVEDLTKISTFDVMLVLGGDGTILKVADVCAENNIKILGVNCGHMGFLADYEADQLDEALSLLIRGKFKTVKRSMLEVTSQNNTYHALNEVVIQRSTSGNSFSNTVNLHAEIDGSTVDNFSSDGLIISTPTGSTAYSLSAGGSILTPDLNALILTPICPHSLHSRPIVFSDKSKVAVCQADDKCDLNLIIDGRVRETIHGTSGITVKKSQRYAEFISVSDKNFFDKLLIKLNIWSK